MRFAEMFCGIGGFRLGLEMCNVGLEKASNSSHQQVTNNNSTRRSASSTEQSESQLPVGSRECSDSEPRLGDAKGRSESCIEGSVGRKFKEFRCVWANDNDKYACQVYRKHWNDGTLQEGDIRAINPDSIPDFDLLTAGFPCQSFSLAGKRKGFQDVRGTLFYEVIRVTEAKRPKLLLLENVRGLLSNDNGKTFGTVLEELGNIGYWVEWQTLNSKYFGVPQNRERVFIVGHFRGESSGQIFPVRSDDEETNGNGSVARTLQGGGHSGGLHSRMSAISVMQIKRTHADGSHLIREYENEVPTLTQQMGTGGNNVPMVIDAKKVGEPRFYDKVTPSLQANDFKEPLEVILNQRIRRLTPIECERLQGFPDGWTAKGLIDETETEISDTQRYRCLGNAITTNVVSFLGLKLGECFMNEVLCE